MVLTAAVALGAGAVGFWLGRRAEAFCKVSLLSSPLAEAEPVAESLSGTAHGLENSANRGRAQTSRDFSFVREVTGGVFCHHVDSGAD